MERQEDRQEAAVAFCRECRGWEDAAIRKLYPERVASKNHGTQFIYDDLEMVMWAAEIWIRNNKLRIRHFYDAPREGPYSHTVEVCREEQFMGCAEGDNLCHVILLACVVAQRQIAATSGQNPAIAERA